MTVNPQDALVDQLGSVVETLIKIATISRECAFDHE